MSIPDPVLSLPDAAVLERSPESLMYLGETRRGREIWLDRDHMTRHMLVVGSTGSGKSEMLLGMSANAIASGNGVLFVDGKGDISTFARLHALADRFGRRDDVLLLNFSQGAPVGQKAGRFLSNTLNPLLDLSADAIVQILVSLMEDAGGDNAMWKGRAIAMLTGVVRAAAWLRDSCGVPLSVGSLRDHCGLSAIVALADPEAHPGMPVQIRKVLNAYLTSLPGFQKNKGACQAQTTLDQHGYLEMQTTRLFSTLADVYGHIFDAGSSHIDMRDVVLNRRIVMVMLPVLEKSRDEVASLGRIVVALLKNMMSSAMQAPLEGPWEDVVERRPTNADYPFLVILDEVSHYMTDGMAAMAGQARSLGFCLVFATQDLGQMEKAAAKETSAILANTNLKVFMRVIDPFELDMRHVLPSNQRYGGGGRSDAEDVMRDRISCLSDRLRIGGRDRAGDDAIWRELSDAYAAKIAIVEENPSWSLVGTVKTLEPGGFVAVQGDKFLLGRSLRIGACLRRSDIRLNHFVRWSPDPATIRERHDRAGLAAAAAAAITSDPAAAFGAKPLAFAGAYARRPTEKGKAGVRRAFAVVGNLSRLAGAEWEQAKRASGRRLVSLGA